MNILPKKRWHVRTKQNIERVRRDEAKAAEEEKERQRRVLLAEQEARTSLLRKRANAGNEPVKVDAGDELVKVDAAEGHVNFFSDVEEGKKTHGTNKEHEIEKREEQETFEKSIGLLTYLGQDCAEEKDLKPWYFNPPSTKRHLESEDEKRIELSKKSKSFHDPLKIMHQYLGPSQPESKAAISTSSSSSIPLMRIESEKRKHKKKHRKRKKSRESDRNSTSSSGKTMEQLRAERLKRERAERLRTEQLLSRLRGNTSDVPNETPVREQQYNSQYNPHLARQREL